MQGRMNLDKSGGRERQGGEKKILDPDSEKNPHSSQCDSVPDILEHFTLSNSNAHT